MRLLQMSVSAGMLIAVILFLRCVGRKFLSARILFLLWFVAAARMVLPLYIPVQRPEITMGTIPDNTKQEEVILPVPGNEKEQVADGTNSEEIYARYAKALFLIWADVALILMILFTYAFMRQSLRFQDNVPLRGNKYLEDWKESHPLKREVGFLYSDKISSPITFGIWHPKIVFPRDIALDDTASVDHILRHEYTHIRRFDNLWKIVMLAAVCVHWFNPLAWVMWHYFNRDMELACDEETIAGLDRKGQLAYAMTLLQFAEKNQEVSLVCNGFGKSPVRERITMIMKSRKRGIKGILCGMMMMALSLTVFTSAKDSSAAEIYGAEGKSPAQILSETVQFKEYEALGMYYSPLSDTVIYNNTVVGHFIDEYSQGAYNRMDDLAGNLCIKAIRNESGKLTGFEEVEKPDDLSQASDSDRHRAQGRALIKEYGPYGMTYDQETGYPSYKGKLVEAVMDQNGIGTYVNGALITENTTSLLIERDNKGAIQEVKELSPEQMSELLHSTIGVYRGDDSWKGDGL